MRSWLFFLLALLLFGFVACQSPTVRRSVQQLVDDGVLTPQQGQAILDAGGDRLLELGATALGSVLTSLGIVWKLRGSVTDRKGKAPDAA